MIERQKLENGESTEKNGEDFKTTLIKLDAENKKIIIEQKDQDSFSRSTISEDFFNDTELNDIKNNNLDVYSAIRKKNINNFIEKNKLDLTQKEKDVFLIICLKQPLLNITQLPIYMIKIKT